MGFDQSERAQGPIYIMKKNKTACSDMHHYDNPVRKWPQICSLKYICSRDNFLLVGIFWVLTNRCQFHGEDRACLTVNY